ncbi:CotH kinase family protein [bacterium]|nr:CotH kinase family protein [bacterium]MBU1635728.1 CotH kinase family protein [bacterium]MBU1872626.1 CotH kinase family protein [bacterium]
MKNKNNPFTRLILFVLVLCVNQGIAQDNSWMIYDDSEVAEIHITVDPDILEWIYDGANLNSDSLHIAQFHFKNRYIDENVENIGFRLRGNTSRASAKKSFKISFNTFVSGREFYGLDKMNLNGEHNDPSIIRSKLCWDFFHDIGMSASRAAHAAVYINDEYYGLYISVEHIDDEFVDKRYADPSGNLWKCLWPADLSYRGPNPEDYYPYQDETRPYELKTNEEEYDYSQLARFIDILNNTSDNDFADSIEQILVVPEVLQYFAMNILTGSWDDYRFLKNNYYLYHEPSIDKFHLIPYDYDNTFGIDWFATDWFVVDPYNYPVNDDSGRPLMRLLDIPEYRNLFTHFIEFYSQNVTDLALIESRIDSIKDMITPWAEMDLYRTYDYGFTINDFHQSYSSNPYSNRHVKNGLKEFINRRNASLSYQLHYLDSNPIIYDLDYRPKQPGPEDSVYVSVAAFSHADISGIEIQFHPGHLTVIESYPMACSPAADAKIAEQADRWTGVIPPLGTGGFGRFQVMAIDAKEASSIYPRKDYIFINATEIQDVSLKINEFLASNEATNSDDAGDYDDWVELVNTGEQTIALSGLYLTDKPDNLTKWQFPFGGGVLEPGAFLVVWCDEDEEQIGYHTNFKLSAGGEFIALVAEDGVTIIDSLSFGEQATDVSFGRFPDGADVWQQFNVPTPGLSNQSGANIDKNLFVSGFSLAQNYPNPFNASTMIEYNLTEKGVVQINILNITGQLIRTLYSGEQPAGEYRLRWDATDQGSGIYFCELWTDAHRYMMKMMLLK